MYDLPVGTKEVTGDVFSILAPDRRKHLALVGKTGVGKSTLMKNMIACDIRAGLGCAVIDPHGGLVNDLLEMIPRHRTNDVIYLNPAGRSRVLGLNLLTNVKPEERPLVV